MDIQPIHIGAGTIIAVISAIVGYLVRTAKWRATLEVETNHTRADLNQHKDDCLQATRNMIQQNEKAHAQLSEKINSVELHLSKKQDHTDEKLDDVSAKLNQVIGRLK